MIFNLTSFIGYIVLKIASHVRDFFQCHVFEIIDYLGSDNISKTPNVGRLVSSLIMNSVFIGFLPSDGDAKPPHYIMTVINSNFGWLPSLYTLFIASPQLQLTRSGYFRRVCNSHSSLTIFNNTILRD